MAFDNTPSDDPFAGVRKMEARVARHIAERNALVRAAKGGNPRKLVSERDLHKHAFAAISASFTGKR